MKLLLYFKNGEKFNHNNQIYTVYQIDTKNNMVEVYTGGRFHAWPIYNGKEMIQVQQIIL